MQGDTNFRQLIKTALLTSPLIALYSILPVLLFVASTFEAESSFAFWDTKRFFYSLTIVTNIVFLQWCLNIWLFTILDKKKAKGISKLVKYLISYAVVILVLVLIHPFRPKASVFDIGAFAYYPFIGAIANNSFILILYSLITTRHQRLMLELDKTKLLLSQSVIQHEQLKNKVHPHFLFNALNTLKLLIRKEPEDAEKYVVRLSDYLRSTVSELKKDTALIKDELSFCMNYLELQKVRFSDAIFFENKLPIDILNNEYLPILTLQSLAENALKHNAFSKDKPLTISLYKNEDESITFSNTLIEKRNIEMPSGTGLNNLSERFILLGSTAPIVSKDKVKEEFKVTFNTIKK